MLSPNRYMAMDRMKVVGAFTISQYASTCCEPQALCIAPMSTHAPSKCCRELIAVFSLKIDEGLFGRGKEGDECKIIEFPAFECPVLDMIDTVVHSIFLGIGPCCC